MSWPSNSLELSIASTNRVEQSNDIFATLRRMSASLRELDDPRRTTVPIKALAWPPLLVHVLLRLRGGAAAKAKLEAEMKAQREAMEKEYYHHGASKQIG